MYSPDKMMNGKPAAAAGALHPPPISAPSSCFPGGRYSPTYRSPDPMRRCMPNPSHYMREVQPATSAPHNIAVWDGARFVHASLHPSDNGKEKSRILEDASIMCNSWSPRHNGDLFSGLNDGLLSRAEALAAVDMGKHQASATPGLPQLKHDVMYHHGMPAPHPAPGARPHQMGHHGMEGLDMLDPISSTSMTTLAPMGEVGNVMASHHAHHAHHHHHHGHGPPLPGAHHAHPAHHHPAHPGHPAHHPAMAAAAAAAAAAGLHPDSDTDPRELEAFAERFKQRRIKLGVTQADVGKALANLKLPGVGALSQSTICRFESLTLSHNNMIALKPILQAWLEEAEAQAKNKRRDPDAPSVLPAGEKKRKRTSIAAPEKRSLEAYFAVQPRPSGEKIAAIAEKLDLKKNVVRVWFCNQRQKQKRMKFAAQH
ncbi:inhibitory POU protein-like [Schistocerca americana]|uniref:inhibitory POU protein-like n=2 Tax=Schistocerca TaxID=7008 RepID=UPI001F4FBF73|nr:inhibitory POU protein-like [Schistocerca americana]XP_049785740.1 inhibitory POU protein-like [Schistocerca cancellata]XP_049961428.1 inhibitory POU protein-like [Schistocerca serialis cubense]